MGGQEDSPFFDGCAADPHLASERAIITTFWKCRRGKVGRESDTSVALARIASPCALEMLAEHPIFPSRLLQSQIRFHRRPRFYIGLRVPFLAQRSTKDRADPPTRRYLQRS